MTGTISKRIEVAGIEFDVEAEFDAAWVDNGIGAYEYWGARGFHHDWMWEVENAYNLKFDCDVAEYIQDDLRARSWFWSKFNPLSWIAVAWLYTKVMREFEKLDANEVWNEAELVEAANEQAPEPEPEPDYERN